jgi:hypothetical protein
MTDNCTHPNSVFLEDVDLVDKPAVLTAIEFGDLKYVQQIEDQEAIRIVTISTSWCPECNAVYGEITAAA